MNLQYPFRYRCLFRASADYISLYRNLKYLLKERYIILMWPDFFLFSGLFVWAGRKHCHMSEKISQKWTPFLFGNTYLHQTFTECVSNRYPHFGVLICQMWLQVMESPLILLRFCVSSYIIDDYSHLNCCISNKLSQIVCLINVHILLCQHAKSNCKLWKVLWFNAFLRIFIYCYMFKTL